MRGGTNTGIEKLLKTPEKYFCPFTCLTKDSSDVIDSIIQSENYLSKATFTKTSITVSQLLSMETQGHDLIYGQTNKDGFPMNFILQAVAYVLAAEMKMVNGKRVRGEYRNLLSNNTSKSVTIYRPDRGTCLKIQRGDFAALVGYVNDDFNKKLIVEKGNKIHVREPVFEECVAL
jgi:hypothetical protein